MDALRSWEFLFSLLCFLTPVAIAAGAVYRRIVKAPMRRKSGRAQLTDARIQSLAETKAIPAPPAPPAAVPAAEIAAPAAKPDFGSIRQPLENLRQHLVEFRQSIQQTSAALQKLQDCDVRCSMDLQRLSATVEQAFPKAEGTELPRRKVNPAA